MAEDKKPKIDLKARLGKAGGAAPAAGTPAAGGIPVPAPVPAPVPTPSAAAPVAGIPAPASSPTAGVTPPPGVPVGPPPAFKGAMAGLDPSNPLAAAVAPPVSARPVQAAPQPPPQPQRIEVDEFTVQEARKGARKQGLVYGLVAAVVLGAVGYIAGGAQESSKARARAVNDAKSLAADVTKAREQLKTLADKVEAGRNTLRNDRKFPESLAKDLNGINVDFDGSKLAGVRFSGFPQETTSGLIEFITQVQGINDRKAALSSLLTRTQKPITEQLSAGQRTNVSYVVMLGEKEQGTNNMFAILAPLTKSIEVNPQQPAPFPAEFTATDPLSRKNITLPKYGPGALEKPKAGVAFPVVPKSVEAACPSESSGMIAQLVGQLNRVINDVRGEKAAPGGDVVTEEKPGLLEKADKLVAGLNRVQ